MLEKEVIRLRESETVALSRMNVLQQHVDVLIQTLKSNGISIPPLSNELTRSQPVDEVPGVIPDREHTSTAMVQVSLPPRSNKIPQVGLFSHSRQSNEMLSSDSVVSSAFPFPEAQCKSALEESTSFSLQDPRVGIDFVLA